MSRVGHRLRAKKGYGSTGQSGLKASKTRGFPEENTPHQRRSPGEPHGSIASLRRHRARRSRPATRQHLSKEGLPPSQTVDGHVEACRQVARMPLDANGNQQQPMDQRANPSALLGRRQPDELQRLQHIIRQHRQRVVHPVGRQARARRVVQVQVAQHLAEPSLHLAFEMMPFEHRLCSAGAATVAEKQIKITKGRGLGPSRPKGCQCTCMT
jgi:hypothetical protein